MSKSMALSLEDRTGPPIDFGPAQLSVVARSAELSLERPKILARTMLNSNRRTSGTIEISIVIGSVPGSSIARTAITRIA
jgi:hypothetical protein